MANNSILDKAKTTIDEELQKQLAGKKQEIFDKLDQMLREKKTRQEIEAALTPMISESIDASLNSRVLFVT